MDLEYGWEWWNISPLHIIMYTQTYAFKYRGNLQLTVQLLAAHYLMHYHSLGGKKTIAFGVLQNVI